MEAPSLDLTVSSVLARRAASDPEAPFLLSPDSRLTYGQTERQAEALAASLAHLGIAAGDRVALVLPAWPEFAVAAFAAARLGATIVPLDPRLTLAELRYMLRHSGATCAISAEDAYGIDFLQRFEDLLVELPRLCHLVTVGQEDLWYDDRIFQWEDLLSAGRGRDLAAFQSGPDDPFAVVYTSGTTGKPKGVELSHRNVLYASGETARVAGLVAGDVVAGVTALFSVFGLGPGLMGTLLGGASLVLQDDFEPATTFDLAERHQATVHYGVPTLFATVLQEIERRGRPPGSVRVCLASGAPMRSNLARRIEEGFGVPLLVAYSLTEAASTLAMSRPSDPREKRSFTVGRAIAGTTVRVTGDDGSLLPPESLGEIRVRGPGVMLRYSRQPGATAAVIDPDGYLRTGDLGMMDKEGYLHLVGRPEDVVIRGGSNVHPWEVEDRLMAHPAVERAAVTGIPDDILGEAVCACVVRVEGGIVDEGELREWCALTLTEYKLPDLVSFMDDLPLADTGRVNRAELARLVLSNRPNRPAEERKHGQNPRPTW